MADVVFKDVEKVYPNGFHAVRDFSLEIKDGEFLVLVGPSGCGKTTALRLVAGLEEISAGELIIGDRVVNNLTPKERDIAMVFQNYALYPHLTVKENIAFGLRLRRESKSEVENRVRWAAQMLDLTPYLERKPKELSGGQRQRVAMGRAIVRQPQVFLMDEPLSNLDAKLRVQMRADIAKLQHDLETTTIYVTHDQVEAMTMGDRVAVMRHGLLQQVADPQTLYDEPANVFVAGFIGTPPMNLLEAEVSANGSVKVQLGATQLEVPEEALSAYPKLRSYGGGKVVVGLRAQYLHPADERPELPKLDARVELVEALGGESIVYFRVDANAVREAHEDEEEVEELEGAGEGVVGTRPNLIAQFPAHVRLQIADEVSVAVEVARMHFFDAATGEPLR
jgi:multiple sugar transport system ATP-binding protein